MCTYCELDRQKIKKLRLNIERCKGNRRVDYDRRRYLEKRDTILQAAKDRYHNRRQAEQTI